MLVYYLVLFVLSYVMGQGKNGERLLNPTNFTGMPCNLANSTDYFFGIRTSTVYKDMKMGRGAFEISYHGSYKLVKDLKGKITYGLYCKGGAQPDNVDADLWLSVPMERVGVSTSVRPALAWLEVLGLRNRIKVVVGDTLSVTTPCIAQGISQGKILGYAEGKVTEAIKKLDIDGLFVGDVSEASSKGSILLSYTAPDLGLIQQAEWIKFVAAFFNLEAKAEAIFAQILDTQRCHVQNVRTLEHRYYLGHVAYAQSTSNSLRYQWDILKATYVHALTVDSGAVLTMVPYPDNQITVSGKRSDADQPLLQEFQDRLAQTTVLLDWSNLTQFLGEKKLGYFTNPDLERDSGLYLNWIQLAGVQLHRDLIYQPAYLRSKKLFSTSKLVNQFGSSDWDETMVTRPDLATADLIYAQYPSYNPDYKPRWLINIAEGQLPTLYASDACSLSPEPFVASTCTVQEHGYRNLNGGNSDFPTIHNVAMQGSPDLSVGGVVGIVLVLLLLGLGGGYYLYRRKKLNRVRRHSLPSRQPINDTFGSTNYNRTSNFGDDPTHHLPNSRLDRFQPTLSNQPPLPKEVTINPFQEEPLALDLDLDEELLGPKVENENRFVYSLDSNTFPQFPKH